VRDRLAPPDRSGKTPGLQRHPQRRPVLFGHIYSGSPFATSFVIVFAIQKTRRGTYGIVLNAPLPKAMDAWGRLTACR
jgi:hypothetical protein